MSNTLQIYFNTLQQSRYIWFEQVMYRVLAISIFYFFSWFNVSYDKFSQY